MTPAEMLKHRLKNSWDRFSTDELYKVFCLLVEQVDVLEKQSKSLKNELQMLRQDKTIQHQKELEQLKHLKLHAKRDALNIIEQTEKISKVILEQVIVDAERVRKETDLLEKKQQEMQIELIDFLELKVEDVKKKWNKVT